MDKFTQSWNAPRLNAFEASTDIYSSLRRPELTPLFVPGFRHGFLDSNGQVMMAMNEQSGSILKNHGSVSVTASLKGKEEFDVAVGGDKKAIQKHAGFAQIAGRPPSGTTLLSDLVLKTTYSLNGRVGVFKVDSIPAHPGQGGRISLNIQASQIVGSASGNVTLYGAIGSFPANVTALDALTLTTANDVFSVNSPTTIVINNDNILAELTAQSGWQYGDSAVFVIVNNADTTSEVKATVNNYFSVRIIPTTIKASRPLMPNGNGFNVGGFAASNVPIGTGGDVTDYSSIYYSGAYSVGDDVSIFLNTPGAVNYVQYLNTSFTTNWRFHNVFTDIPEYLEVAIEANLGQTRCYCKSIKIKDTTGAVIGQITGPNYTGFIALKSGKNVFSFKVPISKRAVNPSNLGYLTIAIEDLKGASSSSSHSTTVNIYSVVLHPIYGQQGRLELSGLNLSDYTVCFWLFTPYGYINNVLVNPTDDATSGYPDDIFLIEDSSISINSTLFTLGNFDHYAIARSGTSNFIYRNGKLLQQSSVTTFGDVVSTLKIGPMNAAINDLRVYAETLDGKEILAMSNATYKPRGPTYPDPDKVETVVTPIYADPLILMLGML